MVTPHQGDELKEQLHARFQELPRVIQNAITSAHVEKRLRTLAEKHKLHLDQWQLLENEVMLTLMGFQKIENLERNIKNEVGLPDAIAREFATSANEQIFEPIRQELERQLAHPEAQEKEVSDVETAREQQLQTGGETAAKLQVSITPATPPVPAPDIKVIRPSESTAYKPGEPSSTRAVVHDDPYRVPPV